MRRVDIIAIAREAAKRRGSSLKAEVERVLWAQIELACSGKEGSTAAAKIVLDRLCGPVKENAPHLHLGLHQTLNFAPTMPVGADLTDYFRRLQEVAKENGLLEGGPVIELSAGGAEPCSSS